MQQGGHQSVPQEARQDNSTAAYQALLSEEAQRMLRHASHDGTHFPARSLLRTPQHLVPLVQACKSLQGLQSLDLALNALSDPALTQLRELCEAGGQLTSLDLSHNQFSSQAAGALCSIISHVSHNVVLLHGTSQLPTPLPVLRPAYSSGSAAQDSAASESLASASGNLDAAAPGSGSSDVGHMGSADSATSSSAPAQQAAAPANQQRYGGNRALQAQSVASSATEAASAGPPCCPLL